MLVVQSEETAALVAGLRHNGHRPYPPDREHYWSPAMVSTDFDIEGIWPFNYSIGEAQSALAAHLIDRLPDISSRRQQQAQSLLNATADYQELSPQSIPPGSTHVYHLMSFRYDGLSFNKNRDHLIDRLSRQHLIQAIVQFYPLYRYPLFANAGFGEADCPNTDEFFDNMISVPFYPWFDDDQQSYLAERLTESLDHLRHGF